MTSASLLYGSQGNTAFCDDTTKVDLILRVLYQDGADGGRPIVVESAKLPKLCYAVRQKALGVGHYRLISHHTELHLPGIADNAYTKTNIAGLGHPEHLFGNGAPSQVAGFRGAGHIGHHGRRLA